MFTQASIDEARVQQSQQGGVSFARIAREGFAATGPALSAAKMTGQSPPGPSTASPVLPAGAWGSRLMGASNSSGASKSDAAPGGSGGGSLENKVAIGFAASTSDAGSGSGGGEGPAASKWLTLGAPRSEQEQHRPTTENASSGSRKKGKSKGVLLFSTASQRRQ